jgi:hypothetical protein
LGSYTLLDENGATIEIQMVSVSREKGRVAEAYFKCSSRGVGLMAAPWFGTLAAGKVGPCILAAEDTHKPTAWHSQLTGSYRRWGRSGRQLALGGVKIPSPRDGEVTGSCPDWVILDDRFIDVDKSLF